MSYPAISLATATVGRHRCPQKRLKTAPQPPGYPNSSPDHRACNSLTPFRCPHAVHPCPSVDSGLADHTDIAGFDLVEVNPQLDVGTGITSYLAAHTIVEFLGRICSQPRWVARREARIAGDAAGSS